MDSLEEEEQQEEDEEEESPKKKKKEAKRGPRGLSGNKILLTIWLI